MSDDATPIYSALEGLSILWGVNRWVLAESNGRSVQRQVSRPSDLAVVIQEVTGADWEIARDRSHALWKERPSDAAAEGARARQSLVGATGVSTSKLLLAIVVFVALWMLVIWLR